MKISPWATGAMKVAMFSAAFALPGTGIAMAGTWSTSGNGSIGGGNQINAPISIPVDVCGNAVSLLGLSAAGCEGGAAVKGQPSHSDRWSTSGDGSVAGGNQVNAPISVPVNVCGNSVAAAGIANSGCKGGAVVSSHSGHHAHDMSGHGGTWSTSGDGSVLGGNQVNLPISVPINVCGNAVALLGQAYAGCRGGAAVLGQDSSGTWSTSGNGSVGGGNQINAPVKAPLNVCGNAAAAAGISDAGCKGGAVVSDHGHKPPKPCKHGHKPPTPPTTPPATPPGHPGHPGGPGGTSTTTTSVTSSTLPTTGADLAAIAGAGLAAVGLGGVSVVAMRRKRATSRI